MPIPQTTFSADECQAILDLLDKSVGRAFSPRFYPDFDSTVSELDATDEEKAAWAKLKDAGALYVPETGEKDT